MSGTTYQLFYFEARARAEPIRMAFKAAGQPFVDTRVNGEEWKKTEKQKAPQGRLPYIVITEGKDAIKVSQSKAILRYVGKELKLNGDDKKQELYINEIIDTCDDLMLDWQRDYFSGSNDQEKAESMNKFRAESVPKFYDMLEKCVKDHGVDGFAVGNRLSIADCVLYNCVQTCGTDCLDKYKSLKSNREKVEQHQELKKYLKERKDTPF